MYLTRYTCHVDSGIDIAVIIPTLNRRDSVSDLLNNLTNQTLLPSLVIIIDASEKSISAKRNALNIVVISSDIKSAAIQRNMGMEYLLSKKYSPDALAFLDDDVSIGHDYLECMYKTLTSSECFAGVSGLAISEDEKQKKRNFIRDLIGISGQPGAITKAAINIPVRNVSGIHKADWLIGCSVWRYSKVKNLRFQMDFKGASIFEDVLFSVEAGRFGKLMVDTSIILEHKLDQRGRQDSFSQYRDWVTNRYRLRRISPSNLNLIKFLIVNFLYLLRLLHKGNFKGAFGIFVGLIVMWNR